MSPSLLRQLWSLIEDTQSSTLLSLDDSTLIQWLLRQVRQHCALNYDETNVLDNYLRSKLSLIRDLAQSRPATNP